jgi:hypothetical protein
LEHLSNLFSFVHIIDDDIYIEIALFGLEYLVQLCGRQLEKFSVVAFDTKSVLSIVDRGIDDEDPAAKVPDVVQLLPGEEFKLDYELPLQLLKVEESVQSLNVLG